MKHLETTVIIRVTVLAFDEFRAAGGSEKGDPPLYAPNNVLQSEIIDFWPLTVNIFLHTSNKISITDAIMSMTQRKP